MESSVICRRLLWLAISFLWGNSAFAEIIPATPVYESGNFSGQFESVDAAARYGIESICRDLAYAYSSCSYAGTTPSDVPDAVAIANMAVTWKDGGSGVLRMFYIVLRYSCPPGYSGSPLSTTCMRPDTCPVTPLTPITDPVALAYENGDYDNHPNLNGVKASIITGANCIIQGAAALKSPARITSAFRPQAYQSHLREVWDKWQLLKNNSNPACETIKADVKTHWVRHAMQYQPGVTSRHTTGDAVDIGGVPQASADSIAQKCNMKRPYSNDRVHYEVK